MSESHHPVSSGESCGGLHSVDHGVQKYLVLFGALLVLTVVTVGLSYVHFGSVFWNIVVALIVATVKASLVAAIFMHLWGEKALIWKVLVATIVFVSGLFVLSYLHYSDPIKATKSSSRSPSQGWRSSEHVYSVGGTTVR